MKVYLTPRKVYYSMRKFGIQRFMRDPSRDCLMWFVDVYNLSINFLHNLQCSFISLPYPYVVEAALSINQASTF